MTKPEKSPNIFPNSNHEVEEQPSPIAITLQELLESRDNRHQLQQQLLRQHPGQSLICLTVIMPGSIKRNRQSLIVGEAAVAAIRDCFKADPMVKDLKTGFEGYLLTTLPLLEAKRMACGLEENHPLGRLFDIDVIGQDGIPVSREAIQMESRKCLLCNHEARFCMRNHSHSQEEIIQRITEMVSQYVQTAHVQRV